MNRTDTSNITWKLKKINSFETKGKKANSSMEKFCFYWMLWEKNIRFVMSLEHMEALRW